MTQIDIRAVPTGEVAYGEPVIDLVVVTAGDVDDDALAHLKNLLAALDSTTLRVVIDVARARCTDLRLLRLLCEARTRRRDHDRTLRIRGLRSANVPDPEHLSLPDLFVVYDESRQDTRAVPAPRVRPVDQASGTPGVGVAR